MLYQLSYRTVLFKSAVQIYIEFEDWQACETFFLKLYFSVFITSWFYTFGSMKTVFLVGYMGVGKTTIGKKLARELQMEFIDLDKFISRNEHRSISLIIESDGESCFRQLEKKYLDQIINKPNVLISTGGGTPCFFDNMRRINANGTSVYLKMDEKSIVNRLVEGTDSRPLLKGKNRIELQEFVHQHLASRKEFYEMAQIEEDVLNFNSNRIKELVEKIKLIQID